MTVPVPPVLVPMEGLDQLIYELHLENRGDVAVALRSLEVELDPTPLRMKFDGEQLTRLLDVADNREAPLDLPPRARRVVYVDLRAVYDLRGVSGSPVASVTACASRCRAPRRGQRRW